MNKEDHYLTGSILRPFGTKGEVILKFKNDIPEKIKKLESIFIEVDGKLVPFFIYTLREKSADTVLAKLEGVDNEMKLKELIGADFYLSPQQIKRIDYLIEEFIDITGYEVKDQYNKHIGHVLEFVDIPENPLLKVKTSAAELLLPANDDLIIEVDDDERYILLNVVDGLSDLD
ncbi:MAG TPA: ribosome maturation factor RimM [Bacteroidales bacterium]|nr:ribosome maturation factor RimM [Bacteroidales bacterium]